MTTGAQQVLHQRPSQNSTIWFFMRYEFACMRRKGTALPPQLAVDTPHDCNVKYCGIIYASSQTSGSLSSQLKITA